MVHDLIAARLAILDVLGSYSHAWDARDADAYAALFEDGARFEVYVPGREQAVIAHAGRDAILEWARRRCAERAGEPQSRHHISGTTFEVLSGDEARTRTMLLEMRRPPGEPPRPYATGVYEDTWRHSAEGWRITSRTLHLD